MSSLSRIVVAVALLGGLLSTTPASATSEAPDRLSTPQLIERAVRTGEIDRATGWLYLAYSVGPDWELVPDRYIGDVPWYGTFPIMRIQRALERMEPGPERTAIETALYGDTSAHPGPGGIGTDRCLAFTAPALTRFTDHYYIEYNPATIGGGVDIEDYVASLETTWVREIDEFGWAAPPLYPPNPAPDGKYHVRIEPLGPLLYGFVTNVGTHAGQAGDNPNTPWTEPDAQASCMTHNSNYEPFPGTTQNALDATSAHEFDHSINYGIGALSGPNDPDLNFSEGGATWKEDEVFDESNDNYNYLWPDFDDDMGEHEGNEYAYWIVWRGMVERYGTGVAGGGEQVMQNYWEITSQNEAPVQLDAMNQALTAAGTNLPDAYHAFAVAVRFLRACGGEYVYPYCLEEGPAYKDFAGPPPSQGTIAAVGDSFSGAIPDNYALDWVVLPTTGGPYDITLQNTSDGGAFRGTVACDTGTRIEVHSIPGILGGGASTGGGAAASVHGFDPTGCAEVFAVLTNQFQTSPDPEESTERNYTLTTSTATGGRTLTVAKVGNGEGTIKSDPAGVTCGESCSHSFPQGQSITLTAKPENGSDFAGWSGDCSGTGTCTVQMNEAKSVFAEFRSTGPYIREPSKPFQSSRTFTVGWGGGTGSYDVRYREARRKRKFGDPVQWQSSIIGREATFEGRPGSTYCFSVGAIETGRSATSFSRESCTAVPLDDRRLQHEGPWKERKKGSAYLGTVSRSNEQGAALVKHRVKAREIAIVATACKRCGRVRAFFNGTPIGNAKLRAKKRATTRIYELGQFGRVRRGTLRVVIVTDGRKVQIEGIGISRV